MGTSNHVDVVMAMADPESDGEGLVEVSGTLVTEAPNVAPDPALRIIVIAPTRAVGAEHVRAQGIDPVAIVTPRSLDAARGVVADLVIEAPGLTPEQRAELLRHVAPSLAMTEVI